MEILKCLENCNHIKFYEITDFKDFGTGYYIKIDITFNNLSKLFITEYIDIDERNYSYHWQDKTSQLIKRWDNAPHHKKISTYPHHIHINNSIFENYNIDCNSIFNEIEKILTQKK